MKSIRLEAGSLLLRPLRMTDARSLTTTVRASAEGLGQFLFWASSDYDLESARAFVRFAREGRESGRGLHLGIFDSARGEFLGMIGLMRMNAVPLGFEIGYWMRTDRRGEGLATLAARRLLRYAFERAGAHRVWLNCDVRNRSSRRVAEKLGMRREGRVKAFLIDPEGKPRDHYLYGILNGEFGS